MDLVTNVVQGSASDRLLLLVHGYGADERDLGGLLTYLDPDGKLAVGLPRAPVAGPGTAGFSWYGVFDGDQGEGSFRTAPAQLDALLDEPAAAPGVHPRQA